jgi:hypothetical protein
MKEEIKFPDMTIQQFHDSLSELWIERGGEDACYGDDEAANETQWCLGQALEHIENAISFAESGGWNR